MNADTRTDEPVPVRPYQLLCLFCSLDDEDGAPCDPSIAGLLDRVRKDPGLPLALRCHSDDSFAYQSPGQEADTPEGADFNQKRDMEILLRMDLAPGAILPARIAVARAHKAIVSVTGICGAFGEITSPAWRGCPLAESGRYERARERGTSAIFPPRDADEMQKDKAASLDAMLNADVIRTRPHILLCAIAQYGRGIRPPFAEDNLPELLQHVIHRPDTPIKFVAGADEMMCAPCPQRCSRGNCLGPGFVHSGGLFNELKDLRILQILGLTFGAELPARELFSLILTRITTTVGSCALGQSVPELSVWWDPCPCWGYEKGRVALMEAIGCENAAPPSAQGSDT